MRVWLLAAVAASAITTPLAAQPVEFGTAVPAQSLREMRGGFALPNGVDVSLAVHSETVVDGRTILRTVYQVTDAARLDVAVARDGALPQSATAAAGPPQIVTASGATVRLVTDSTPAPAADDGMRSVTLNPGQTATTPDGVVSLVRTAGGDAVTLANDLLSTTHMMGDVLGSVTVNRANDLTIQTATTIDLNLANLTATRLDAAALTADRLASDAVGQLSQSRGF